MYILNKRDSIYGKSAVSDVINIIISAERTSSNPLRSTQILQRDTLSTTSKLILGNLDENKEAEFISIISITLTNTSSSEIGGISLDLYNGYNRKTTFVSNISIKANTTIVLSSSGFSQNPPEKSENIIYTGSGGEWGSFTGDIQAQSDLINIVPSKSSSLVSGETISSGMAVVIWTDGKVYKYNISNENHAGLTCGIAKTSGLLDETIEIILPGNIHTEVGSEWAAGESYFVSSTSLLTIAVPSTGIVKKIATGIAPDTVLVNDYNEFITI